MTQCCWHSHTLLNNIQELRIIHLKAITWLQHSMTPDKYRCDSELKYARIIYFVALLFTCNASGDDFTIQSNSKFFLFFFVCVCMRQCRKIWGLQDIFFVLKSVHVRNCLVRLCPKIIGSGIQPLKLLLLPRHWKDSF